VPVVVRSVPVVWRASIITGNRAGGLVRSVPVVWCDPCRWSGAPVVPVPVWLAGGAIHAGGLVRQWWRDPCRWWCCQWWRDPCRWSGAIQTKPPHNPYIQAIVYTTRPYITASASFPL